MNFTQVELQNAFALISQEVEAKNQQAIVHALSLHVQEYLDSYIFDLFEGERTLVRIHDETMSVVGDWIWRKLPDYCKTLSVCEQYFRKIDFTLHMSFEDTSKLSLKWNEFYTALRDGTAPINTIIWTPQKIEEEWIKLHGTSKRP